MNTLRNLFLASLLAVGIASAQYTTSPLTLAAPMGIGDQTVTLSASTGVSAQGVANQVLTALVIDQEYLEVVANVAGNQWQVRRTGGGNGGGGSVRSAHANGATVYVGVPGAFDNGPNDLVGPCTGTAVRPNVRTHNISRCVAAVWQQGVAPRNPSMPFTGFATLANPGNLIAPTSVTHVDGTEWFSQISFPYNATLTGACWMNGATVTTDNTIAFLTDASGAVLATSALAGAADTGHASQYQCAAFLATVAVVGPATYYVGIQTKGTTDNFLAYATGGAPTGYGTGSQTGTFGTIAAITPTTTFTPAKGPLLMVY
jgi:hypothetical protein